jgi:hypothetical protein
VIHDSEYLWGDRNAASPTPPLEMRTERRVIHDKGPGDGLANPAADEQLLQKYQPSNAALSLHPAIEQTALSGLTEAQRPIILARLQENFSAAGLHSGYGKPMLASQEMVR